MTTPPQVYRLLKSSTERVGSKWGKSFYQRLINDGGSKILKFEEVLIHKEFSTFIQPINEIKGLSLDNSLKQLRWNQSQASKALIGTIEKSLIKLSENDFNLNKTYIAHAYVKDSNQGLQRRFVKMIKGRGRYGSTPHPKFSKILLVFQEREKGFEMRENDKLEPIRQKLRDQMVFQKSPEELLKERLSKRVVKEIYQK